MDIHKKHRYSGNWWRVNKFSEKIPGILDITQNRTIKLRPDRLFSTKNGIHHFPSKIGTIWGKNLKGELITLLNCQSLFGDTYDSPLALVGDHYQDNDDISFKSIRIFYTSLTEWVYKKEYLKDHGISFKIKEFGITIVFNIESEKRIRKQKSEERITSSITIISENKKSLQEWWDITILLRNFIILGLNIPIYPYYILGYQGKKSIKIFRITNTNYGFHSEKIKHKGYLFKLQDIEDSLDLYLGNLLKISERLKRFTTDYYSILNNPDIYNSDKFLNLISILEGYHRYNMVNEEMPKEVFTELKKEILDKSKEFLNEKQIEFVDRKIYEYGYEKSLNKRLCEILDNCKSFISINERESKKFTRKIIKTRNTLAHGLLEDEKKIQKNIDIYRSLEALEFLFVVSVLKEIGFSDNTLKKLISGFNKFNWPYSDIARLFQI